MATIENREVIFLVLFIASLGLNIYFFIIQQDGKDEYFPTHCDDQYRYSGENENGGGIGISLEEAQRLAQSFGESNPETKREFIFSKQAIDRLFDLNETANVLHVIIGKDDEENVGIISVSQKNYANIFIEDHHRFIMAENQCPNQCFDF